MARKIEQPFKPGDIVTVAFDGLVASNTFIIKQVIGDSAYLYHPLFPDCLVEYKLDKLNTVPANLKDSTERSLDFAKINNKYLGYPMSAELEAISMFFVLRRKLTPKQKHLLSMICGHIASVKLNQNVQEAIKLINANEGLLDDFNTMWYKAFYNVFSGRKKISSKKQRDAIFNMAGFILAELENPTTPK